MRTIELELKYLKKLVYGDITIVPKQTKDTPESSGQFGYKPVTEKSYCYSGDM